MGTIDKRSGNYRAIIRKKSRTMSATFSDKVTAEIWVKYHEDLIDNLENFQVPSESLVTIEDCIDFKIESLRDSSVTHRTIADFEICKQEFKEIMDCPLNELTPEMVRELSKIMLKSIVRKGGHKDVTGSGVVGICSPSTVLRKLRVLAAAISFMIEKGANITNPVQVVVNQVKMSLVKKGEDLDE